MTRIILAAALALAAGAASAQSAPPPAPPSGPPASSPPTPAPAGTMPATPHGRGVMIRLQRQDFGLTVRCAESDTTRTCGEVAAMLLDKLAAVPNPGRPERGMRDGERGFREGGGERYERGGRGGYRDRDGD